MRLTNMSIRCSLAVLLVALAAAGCKHKAAGPTAVATQPRIAGPTADSIHDEEIQKLRAQLQILPDLGEGVNFTDPYGEIWTQYKCGLMIHDLHRYDGIVPQIGQTVTITYIGTFPGGTKEFDSAGANHPLSFPLGSKQYVKGLSMGISTMHMGYKRRIYIPADLAYGEKGNPDGGVGPNQPLIFEVDLLKVKGDPVPMLNLPDFAPAGPKMPASMMAPATGP